MPEAREEDEREPIPIPLKALTPAIPSDERELQELAEDLRVMGCAGLLSKPWNLKAEDTLREFKFERGNQWLGTKRRDPENWTPDTWNRVYGFPRGISEGWAGRRDGLFVGKFRGDADPKDGFHPGNCRNLRERRVLEFLLPILNPDKPKRISLTMANTLFGAMSGVRPVNWGLIIQEIVGRALPHIGRKPSFLSPFILHLYQHYDCILAEEEDLLTIAADEVTYKLLPEAGDVETETSSDPILPEAPPSSPGSPPPAVSRPLSPPPPHHHPEAGPSRETTWRNVDLSAWDFPENPFKRMQEGMEELQTQYFRLEHIVRGANHALDDCGPGNILRELAKRADRKELEQARTENAHLAAQVAAMTQELSQKSEEIRKYHAEQAVLFSRIRELVGHPAEIVNKAHLYDRMMESAEPASARQILPILVKYSRTMKDLLADIQKVVPPSGTPRRVLYPGPPGSPTGTLYEVVGEVALVQNPPPSAGPSQQGGGSRPASSGRAPEPTRSPQVRRKSTGSVRSGRGQSPVPRNSDRSRTPDRVRTPIRHQTSDRETTPGRGKAPMTFTSPSSPPDCQMASPLPPPPSRAASSRDPRTASGGRNPELATGSDPSPVRSIRMGTVSGTPGTVSGTPGTGTPRTERTADSDDEVAPSPNMRRMLTRLQKASPGGGSSVISGIGSHQKKKPRSS